MPYVLDAGVAGDSHRVCDATYNGGRRALLSLAGMALAPWAREAERQSESDAQSKAGDVKLAYYPFDS